VTETALARAFRLWFLAQPIMLKGYCPACAQEVTTVGPRGGDVWKFDGHLPDCLLARVYDALCERGDR
jgi:hypothetical protein